MLYKIIRFRAWLKGLLRFYEWGGLGMLDWGLRKLLKGDTSVIKLVYHEFKWMLYQERRDEFWQIKSELNMEEFTGQY